MPAAGQRIQPAVTHRLHHTLTRVQGLQVLTNQFATALMPRIHWLLRDSGRPGWDKGPEETEVGHSGQQEGKLHQAPLTVRMALGLQDGRMEGSWPAASSSEAAADSTTSAALRTLIKRAQSTSSLTPRSHT